MLYILRKFSKNNGMLQNLDLLLKLPGSVGRSDASSVKKFMNSSLQISGSWKGWRWTNNRSKQAIWVWQSEEEENIIGPSCDVDDDANDDDDGSLY